MQVLTEELYKDSAATRCSTLMCGGSDGTMSPETLAVQPCCWKAWKRFIRSEATKKQSHVVTMALLMKPQRDYHSLLIEPAPKKFMLQVQSPAGADAPEVLTFEAAPFFSKDWRVELIFTPWSCSLWFSDNLVITVHLPFNWYNVKWIKWKQLTCTQGFIRHFH